MCHGRHHRREKNIYVKSSPHGLNLEFYPQFSVFALSAWTRSAGSNRNWRSADWLLEARVRQRDFEELRKENWPLGLVENLVSVQELHAQHDRRDRPQQVDQIAADLAEQAQQPEDQQT